MEVNKGKLNWFAIFAFLTLVISEVDIIFAHSCLHQDSCDPSQCEISKDCPGGLTMDVCNCCKVCARVENQTCGGEYNLLGKCDRGLKCVISPKVGYAITGYEEGICQAKPCVEKNTYFGCNIMDFECICSEITDCEDPQFAFSSRDLCEEELDAESEEEKPDCSKTVCEIVFQPECPMDSLVAHSSPPPGQCCPLPGHCVCNPQICPELACPDGYIQILKIQGTGHPGHCCDLYDCVHGGLECDEDCPIQECPEDSYPLPGIQSSTDCCPKPQGCECLPKICEEIMCPDGLLVKLIVAATGKPGACCNEFKCINATDLTCYFKDQQYANGDSWYMDKCTSCSCRDGLTFCHAIACDQNNACGRMAIPPGECCPVCVGCVSSSGELYNNSDIWKEDDDCTFCRCDNGIISCRAEMCAAICENPHKVQGQCCPVCEEATIVTLPPHCQNLENCSLPCEFGLSRNREGCYVCQCKPDNCRLECEYGYQTDEDDHEICKCALPPSSCPSMENCKKRCGFGFKKNMNGCDMCKCKKCKDLECSKRCLFGYRKNDRGCHICKCNDPPPLSSATNVYISSFTTEYPLNVGKLPTRKGPPCLTLDHRRFEDGETWYDGCRECYCHNGNEMCALITCPTPNCASPVIKAGDCCPKCVDEPLKPVMVSNSTICQSVDGLYVEGETWNLDSCTHCTCHHGRVLCDVEECPPLLCHDPVREQKGCCPRCLEPHLPTGDTNIPERGCDQNNRHFESGESWKPNICQSCLCYSEKIQCFTEKCPKLKCEKPVLQKGHCCPMCLETRPNTNCLYKGLSYSKGERWNVNECTDCVCLAGGEQQCTKKICSIACENPIKIPGQCCSLCKDLKSTKNFTAKYPLSPSVGPTGSPHVEGDSHSANSQIPVILLILFITIVIILIIVIAALLFIICRRRNQISLRDLEKTPQPLLQPRPKSTNLEFQGTLPDHKSNCNQNYNEKNNCDCDYKKLPDYSFKNIAL